MTAPMRRGAQPGRLRSYAVRRVEASSSPVEGAGATARLSAAEQLRALASRVRRIGLSGRFDPEAAFIERDELAHALRRLADSIEHGVGRPSAVTASTSRALLPRRFAAVLAAKASEIASLRALLAEAVRPGRRRRRVASETQLMLPLPEAANEG
jgi:hypothetical protein